MVCDGIDNTLQNSMLSGYGLGWPLSRPKRCPASALLSEGRRSAPPLDSDLLQHPCDRGNRQPDNIEVIAIYRFDEGRCMPLDSVSSRLIERLSRRYIPVNHLRTQLPELHLCVHGSYPSVGQIV